MDVSASALAVRAAKKMAALFALKSEDSEYIHLQPEDVSNTHMYAIFLLF